MVVRLDEMIQQVDAFRNANMVRVPPHEFTSCKGRRRARMVEIGSPRSLFDAVISVSFSESISDAGYHRCRALAAAQRTFRIRPSREQLAVRNQTPPHAGTIDADGHILEPGDLWGNVSRRVLTPRAPQGGQRRLRVPRKPTGARPCERSKIPGSWRNGIGRLRPRPDRARRRASRRAA
jgi:hypothetical protein